VFSQENRTIQLYDADDHSAIQYAHVQNLTQNKYTISTKNGLLKLPVQLGDSIWVSCVAYQSKGVIIGQAWADLDTIKISLVKDTIYLDELTFNNIPSEALFKQKILKQKIQDPDSGKVKLAGLKPVLKGPNKLLDKKHISSPLFAITHPVSFFHYNLSKREKEKRKAKVIEDRERIRWVIDQKYNRAYVQSLTDLQGDELTDFISYCNFEESYLLKTSQYQLSLAIMEKLKSFKNQEKG
jgi:hypothetical protein